MKKKRVNEKTNWNIYLPILSMIFVAILFAYSNFYTEKWNFDWKGIRNEIKDSIELLDRSGEITFDKTDFSGRKVIEWYRQKWLLENVNELELVKLTDYPSGTVKAIAYEGLIRKSDVDIFPLLEKSLNDTLTFVHYQSGCIVTSIMLSDYLFSYLTNLNDELPPIQNPLEIKLTEKQKSEIVSLFKKRKSKEDYYKEEYFKRLQ